MASAHEEKVNTFCRILEDSEEHALIEGAISYLKNDYQKFWDWLDAAVKLDSAKKTFCEKR